MDRAPSHNRKCEVIPNSRFRFFTANKLPGSQEKQERQESEESHPEQSSATGTRRTGNGCVNSGKVPYHKIAEIRQPRAGVAEWHTQRT
jgi:hypothetical protein